MVRTGALATALIMALSGCLGEPSALEDAPSSDIRTSPPNDEPTESPSDLEVKETLTTRQVSFALRTNELRWGTVDQPRGLNAALNCVMISGDGFVLLEGTALWSARVPTDQTVRVSITSEALFLPFKGASPLTFEADLLEVAESQFEVALERDGPGFTYDQRVEFVLNVTSASTVEPRLGDPYPCTYP